MNEANLEITFDQSLPAKQALFGVRDADIRHALATRAESGMGYLRHDDKSGQDVFLLRAPTGVFTLYVEFSKAGNGYHVLSVWGHRVTIVQGRGSVAKPEDRDKPLTPERWHCRHCDEDIRMVDDVSIRYLETDLPATSGMRCPGCGYSMIPEDIVRDELHEAEKMLEAK